MFDSNVELNNGVAIGNVGNNICTNSKSSGKPKFPCSRHDTQLSKAFKLSARPLYFNAAHPVRENERQKHEQIPPIRRRDGVYALSSAERRWFGRWVGGDWVVGDEDCAELGEIPWFAGDSGDGDECGIWAIGEILNVQN